MNWTVLKSLDEIYRTGKTKKKTSLLEDQDILHLLKNTKELGEYRNDLVKRDGFDLLYENRFLSNYGRYLTFLESRGLLRPQSRFQESDLKILMDLDERMENGELDPIRAQIISNEETVRGVSQMFFRDEKYLEGRSSLVDAVKQILKIDTLANDKDQQYLYVLKCHAPQRIVLCENLDFLKRPTAPRANNVELWYAGGKNIAKLDYTGTPEWPVYYSCDWDYDGMKIFEAVSEKITGIQLLIPDGTPRSISVTKHASLWNNEPLSGLDPCLYSERAKELISELIENDQWIMEESNDLLKMLGLR
ncbi:hypothetical protein [Flavobacterium macacae]|uniref:Wadjet protein JetD C-terminal domain-containing protein n=1 Tax=Flavobacterium macacae TaxID=2488993 RepID=A0A3P3W6H1_9FLAO|nr:hypothetical protein [Flavobacterium macacae]RRJ90775.1 hypothetical protein EG849_09870 [Flavobacterium macacae]